MNKFQQLEKDVKDFFAINNMINNNFANNNENNNKSLDISMMNGTFINDNQMNICDLFFYIFYLKYFDLILLKKFEDINSYYIP